MSRLTSRPVFLGVITTGRTTSLGRLLDSLHPVNDDPDLHVVVLDNGPVSEHPATRACVAQAARMAAGRRLCIRSDKPLAPLHVSRRLIGDELQNQADSSRGRPVLWMLDDDLVFEVAVVKEGRLHRVSVARQRLREVRELADRNTIDVLVGGFTGDPPIRPDAVQATQLGDLALALRTWPANSWSVRLPSAPPHRRFADDYYDHAEGKDSHLHERVPWVPRGWCGVSGTEQFLQLCRESRRIASGGTPFRPLLEEHTGRGTFTLEPRRGGSAVFFSPRWLQEHTYPAIPVGKGWSRRSDMIGAALLARQGARIFEGGLSLLHDRTGQQEASFDPAFLAAEFAGVLLTRLVTRGAARDAEERALLAAACERVSRIRHCQELAEERASTVLGSLDDRTLPRELWSSLDALAESVERTRAGLALQRREGAWSLLLERDQLNEIATAARSLVATLDEPRTRVARREAACAGI